MPFAYGFMEYNFVRCAQTRQLLCPMRLSETCSPALPNGTSKFVKGLSVRSDGIHRHVILNSSQNVQASIKPTASAPIHARPTATSTTAGPVAKYQASLYLQQPMGQHMHQADSYPRCPAEYAHENSEIMQHHLQPISGQTGHAQQSAIPDQHAADVGSHLHRTNGTSDAQVMRHEESSLQHFPRAARMYQQIHMEHPYEQGHEQMHRLYAGMAPPPPQTAVPQQYLKAPQGYLQQCSGEAPMYAHAQHLPSQMYDHQIQLPPATSHPKGHPHNAPGQGPDGRYESPLAATLHADRHFPVAAANSPMPYHSRLSGQHPSYKSYSHATGRFTDATHAALPTSLPASHPPGSHAPGYGQQQPSHADGSNHHVDHYHYHHQQQQQQQFQLDPISQTVGHGYPRPASLQMQAHQPHWIHRHPEEYAPVGFRPMPAEHDAFGHHHGFTPQTPPAMQVG